MAAVDTVLIVGGGIAGLTLAAALRRWGFGAEVVERNPDREALGAGLLVQANGVRALRSVGLDAALRDAGTVVERWVFADQHGETLSESDLRAVWGDAGPCVGIARARLQDVLLRGAAAVPTRLGTSITALAERAEGVAVTFTDGTTRTYGLVVGADGIHSIVRRLAFAPVTPTYSGQMAWRSLARLRLPGAPSVQFWLGEGCFFGLCSVGDGLTYGFGNTTQARQRIPVERRLARLREHFAAFGPLVQEYLACIERDTRIHCSPIEWVEQEQWWSGRVVLVGDAAHASSPMMGQGGCLAMEDAWVLAEELRAAPTVEAALARYAERRKPRVQWVQQQSRAVGESLRLPAEVRNTVLRERGSDLFRARFAPLTQPP